MSRILPSNHGRGDGQGEREVCLRPRGADETVASSSCDTEVQRRLTAQWRVCGKTGLSWRRREVRVWIPRELVICHRRYLSP